ncbi:MAG TPA: hypothetical protein VM120_02000 [Bryobacteraceae bacterium]|nr:hypothetical protein [Bryobacteraceae bacterium]
MTSTQYRYAFTSMSPSKESAFVADEWRFLSERSLEAKGARPIPKMALVGLGFMLGTGAISPIVPSQITGFGPTSFVITPANKATGRFSVIDVREEIIAIRSLLGINVSELAAILDVQRPTIYSWQAGSAEPHAENRNRLRRTYQLASRWTQVCSEPIGDWVRRPLDESGRTLVSLLSESTPNEALIEEAFKTLKIPIEQEALVFAGVGDRARKLGYKDRSKRKQESSANRETLV